LAKHKNSFKNKNKSTDNIPGEARNYRFDFIGRSKFVVMASTLFIIAGIILFFVRGFNFGIDFRGGNLMEVQFTRDVEISELRQEMDDIGFGTAILQSTGNRAILQSTISDRWIIRTTKLTDEEKTNILDSLDESIGITRPLLQDREVDAGFSRTITKNALIAVAISIVGILIYIWIRFAARFAFVAIAELLHDLLIILSFYIITFREFNTTTIAVILTILGYSLSDGIVIFDRMREELRINRRDRFIDIANYSMNKTLVRSLITGTTSLFPIIVILIIGNETLKDFAIGLTLGIISGSYSSIFIGPPILTLWNNRFQKYKK
jgi:preprotein translocase SecF subunit